MANREAMSRSSISQKGRRGSSLRGAARPKLTRLEKKLLTIQTSLNALFRRASPRSRARHLGWMSVDIAGLWEVSKNHERHVRQLLKCSYPGDRAKIESLLTEMQVNLLSQGADHLKTLQRILPRIRSAVYQRRQAH
jgi:hypothetical protein